MFFSRSVALWVMCFALIWSATGHAGEKPSAAIKGTWVSEEGSLTFTPGGTVNYKGKSYYYAVSNGGIIQLKGRHGSKALPYQLAGDKLTLTVDGKSTVYKRRK